MSLEIDDNEDIVFVMDDVEYLIKKKRLGFELYKNDGGLLRLIFDNENLKGE